MKFVLVLLQTLLCFTSVTAARNPASEKICQKFLTKQKTSPLDPNNKRNFTRDENAEFECELVLQDQTLPLQIRSTIHEGMSWLAVRHCQAGLRRHRDVVRNLEVLLRMSPHHHNFALRAGYWSLDPYVNNIKEATGYLESAVNGAASVAPIQYVTKGHPKQQPVDEENPNVRFTPEEDIYFARRHLIDAYCTEGQYLAAMREVLASLAQYPVDFGVVALYKQLKGLILQNDPESTAALLEEESVLSSIQPGGHGDNLIMSSELAYAMVSERMNSVYEESYPSGIPSLVHLDEATRLSYAEFNQYVRTRTPVRIPAAVSLLSDVGLAALVDKLSDCAYLFSHTDEHTELSVEISNKPKPNSISNADGTSPAETYEHLGYGIATRKAFVNYLEYLEKVYCVEYRGDDKPKTDGKSRANIMAGQQAISTSKHNYYATTQIRENPESYYKLKNDKYVGAYFDQQPIFMQYVIDAAKARKKFKNNLIYVDYLSVEDVAAQMELYDADVAAKTAAKVTANSRLYNSPLSSYLPDLEAAIPSVLLPTSELDTIIDVDVDGNVDGNVDVEGRVSRSTISSGDEDLYDIWGNMTDINLWMGRNSDGVTTKSRLHMDPHDNLYTLISGRKSFLLISPAFASRVQTVYPTYSIGKNGMSFRTGGNIFIPWEKLTHNWKSNEEFVNIVPPALFTSDTVNSQFSSLLPEQVEEFCKNNDIPYEIVELSTPGDRLFVPSGWFHQVTSYDSKHMAMNHWWRPYGWKENAKTYEAEQLGSLRENLLTSLNAVRE